MALKKGSRRLLEIQKKQALNKGNKRKYVRIDFRLWKRKNGISADQEIWGTRYDQPFSRSV